jgi:hypothetical protein
MNDNQETDFMTWFESLSDEQQIEVMNDMRRFAAEMGVTIHATEEEGEPEGNPEEEVHADQDRIDDIAASLLADLDIEL